MLRYTWTCSCCGKQFDDLPLAWDVRAPEHYEEIPESERQARAELTTNFCSIDGDAFYIRGLIEIPVIGRTEKLAWGAWASLSSASKETVLRVWDRPDRDNEGPFFGWLGSAMPLYPTTLHLKTRVHLRAPPLVPYIELEPTDHPLAVEQRRGVTVERVIEIAEALLPRH
ncbi:MAG TPA: DUF2199 domain-containing protein [Xanthobacteraceae bacterium]